MGPYRCQERLSDESRTGIQLCVVSTTIIRGYTVEKRVHTKSFISEISLSTSSINWIMKSTSLCLSISSTFRFVIRNEIS